MASATRAGHRWLKWVGFLSVLCAIAFAVIWYARNANGNEPALNTVAVSEATSRTWFRPPACLSRVIMWMWVHRFPVSWS